MLRTMLTICIVILVLGSTPACALGLEDGPVKTSLYDLMTNPSTYDKKLVKVTGFLCLNNDPSVVFSYRDCDDSNVTMGVGLQVSSAIRLERESHGHRKYGEVTGEFHAGVAGDIGVDTVFNSYIKVESTTPTDISFASSFDAYKPLAPGDERFQKVQTMAKILVQGLKNSEYEKLGELFIPSKSSRLKVYVDDLKNSSSRIGWVFFGAESSLHKFAEQVDIINVEVFALSNSDDLIGCIQNKTSPVSFLPNIAYVLNGKGDKFCFTVLQGKALSVADFMED